MQLVIQIVPSKSGLLATESPMTKSSSSSAEALVGRRSGACSATATEPSTSSGSPLRECSTAASSQSVRPGQIVGDFIAYLLERFRSRIELVNVIPARRKRSVDTFARSASVPSFAPPVSSSASIVTSHP